MGGSTGSVSLHTDPSVHPDLGASAKLVSCDNKTDS